MLKLSFEKRDIAVKPENIRKEGKLPAVFYGKKDESTPISVNESEFMKVWKEAGESTVVILENGEEKIEALIHDVDVHPVNDKPIHADFYVFEKGKKLEVSVPIEFIGTAPAEKELGGILVKVLHELSVKAKPSELPHSIKVDVSGLTDFDSVITAKELKLPEGVELDENPDEVVISVSEPREEEPEEAPTEVDMESIEVESKGKEETEEEKSEEKPSQ